MAGILEVSYDLTNEWSHNRIIDEDIVFMSTAKC